MGAVSDIKKSDEYNKKPPLFKKLFNAGSVEEEEWRYSWRRKKAEDMREQLKQIITFTRGMSELGRTLKEQKQISVRKDKS